MKVSVARLASQQDFCSQTRPYQNRPPSGTGQAKRAGRGFLPLSLARIVCLGLLVVVLSGCSFKLNPSSLPTRVLKLPFSQTRISFDEISYDAGLDRVIVPAAETGTLALVDPTTQDIRLVQGFSQQQTASTPIVGSTSAVSVQGRIYALDKGARKIRVIDPETRKIISAVNLQGDPDVLRFVSATNELWVTEPALEQIEVFKIIAGSPPILDPVLVIPVPNGPEALLVDQTRGLAYTNQPKVGFTAQIQVMTHNIIDTWGNGCSKARGLAFDRDRELLFVACNEGKLVLIDTAHDGLQITSENYGGQLDAVAYNPALDHVYLPSAASAIVAVFAVVDASTITPTPTPRPKFELFPGTGATKTVQTEEPKSSIVLVRLGTADTALNANCITFDKNNNLWVCDPDHGQILIIQDTFPPGGP